MRSICPHCGNPLPPAITPNGAPLTVAGAANYPTFRLGISNFIVCNPIVIPSVIINFANDGCASAMPILYHTF